METPSEDVTIACFFGSFASLLALGGGFLAMTASGPKIIAGFFLVVVALGEFFAVVGFWTREPWARTTGILLFGVHALYHAVVLLSGTVTALFGLVVAGITVALVYGVDSVE